MKRAFMFLAVGALILGSALSALAQAPAAPAGPTVSFGGQMRIFGFVADNITDFRDSQNDGTSRDSNSFFFQRFRLFTTIESADKKAKAYWALEIGDIFWGLGGGASGGEFGCIGASPTVPATANVPAIDVATGQPVTIPAPVAFGTPAAGTRVGPGAGGCLGNDGVNVETKNLYLWFEVPGVEGASLLLGIHNIVFMTGPIGAFMDDDGAGIQLNWKRDPIDLQLYTIKVSENAIANADDVDMHVARFGVNLTKDLRVTLEGMVVDQRNLAGQDFGDSFWVGGTVGAKIGDINLDGAFVYGQRAQARAAGVAAGAPFEESGYGGFVSARLPLGPLSIFTVGWYTSGDDLRGPGTASNAAATRDSDKLPLPIGAASWFNAGSPWIAEGLFGHQSIGAPAPAGNTAHLYEDPTGTYGVGASATYALTPAISVGGGAAYVGATDAPSVRFGDNVITVDGGVIYRYNPNLTITGVASYLFPDTGDNAWIVGFRTQFSF